jgi:phospholipase/carboxylesterase
MTNTRKLTGPIIDNGSSTKFLVFFLHGWGSDGNDLIQIGEIWKSKLLNTTFIAPNGPEVCGGNPHGRQWFDILSNNDAESLKGLHQSYLDLKSLIYTSLREKLLGVVGYSGAFLGNLPKEEIKNNDYLLLHGQNDNIVPINKMHNAVEKLEPFAKTLIKKTYNDLEHSINEEGIIEGLNFIKERK